MRVWIFATLALALVSLDKSAGKPVDSDLHALARRDTDPEVTALSTNGGLPSGTTTKSGYAMDISTYPSSVSSVLSTTSGSIATSAQVATLKYYLTLASNTYCKTVLAKVWSCPHCSVTSDLKFVNSFVATSTDTNVILVRGDAKKTIYISFRGSNSFKNVIADIDFIPVAYSPVSGGKVHQGFLNSYNSVKTTLYNAVKAQITAYPTYSVVVTGHSLGGATALLCALDLYQKGHRPVLYTYGQPRVGNLAFANYVIGTGIRYIRGVNKRDIVPHLPPAAFGFRHAGEEFWIKKDGSVDICPNGIETKKCSNSIVPFTSIKDHTSYFGIDNGGCT